MLILTSCCFLAAFALAAVGAAGLIPLHPREVKAPRLALRVRVLLFCVGAFLAPASIITLSLFASSTSALALPVAIAVSVLPWLLMLFLGAAVAWLMSSNEPLSLSTQAQLRELVTIATRREPRRGFTIVYFDDERPIACAVPGRTREILVSSGLQELLAPEQLEAVIAHEYAHIHGHHAAVLRAAELLTSLAPRNQRGRAFIQPIRLLIELSADTAAARQLGPAALANALVRVSAASADVSLEYRAECIATRRWPISRHRHVPSAFASPARARL